MAKSKMEQAQEFLGEGMRKTMADKLEELMIYIAQQSKDDPNFNDDKMKAILFLSDFRAYAELGQSITGATYIKEAE